MASSTAMKTGDEGTVIVSRYINRLECIYNLIPIEPLEKPRPPRFDSSKIRQKDTAAVPKGVKSSGAMGKPKGACVESPKHFLKKHAKEPALPEPKKFVYADRRKPSLPKETGKVAAPVQKDFVKANAIDAMLMESKKPAQKPKDPHELNPDFGKVPEYLQQVKQEIQEEYSIAQKMEEERIKQEEANKLPPGTRLLSEEEKVELLTGLKLRHEKLENEYRVLPLAIDTPTLRNRKDRLEKDLAQVEQDITKLSKKVVYVTE